MQLDAHTVIDSLLSAAVVLASGVLWFARKTLAAVEAGQEAQAKVLLELREQGHGLDKRLALAEQSIEKRG